MPIRDRFLKRSAPHEAAPPSDTALKVSGVVLALALVGAASLEMARNNGVPKVNGLQHLAVFARPARIRDERLRQAGETPAPKDIDFEPTATIAPPEFASVRKVERDRVTITTREGDVTVRIGAMVEGYGQLVAIVGGEGAWRPVFSTLRDGQNSR